MDPERHSVDDELAEAFESVTMLRLGLLRPWSQAEMEELDGGFVEELMAVQSGFLRYEKVQAQGGMVAESGV